MLDNKVDENKSLLSKIQKDDLKMCVKHLDDILALSKAYAKKHFLSKFVSSLEMQKLICDAKTSLNEVVSRLNFVIDVSCLEISLKIDEDIRQLSRLATIHFFFN